MSKKIKSNICKEKFELLLNNGQFGSIIEQLKQITDKIAKGRRKSILTSISEIFISLGTIVTAILVVYAYKNYGSFLHSLDIANKSLTQMENSVNIARSNLDQSIKNIKLTHQPVVFVIPAAMLNIRHQTNPFKTGFFVKNSGKLPAVDVDIYTKYSAIFEPHDRRSKVIENFESDPITRGIKIYPGTQLRVFPEPRIGTDDKEKVISKAEITFYVVFKSAIHKDYEYVKQKFAFNTVWGGWQYVNEDFTQFKNEILRTKPKSTEEYNKRKSQIMSFSFPDIIKKNLIQELDKLYKAE